jgi:hypothetical protein
MLRLVNNKKKKVYRTSKLWNLLYGIHYREKNCNITEIKCYLVPTQLTLVRLKHAAALFNSFSATCSMDCVVSFNDSSELHAYIIKFAS